VALTPVERQEFCLAQIEAGVATEDDESVKKSSGRSVPAGFVLFITTIESWQ
jgi:hypothetical protein